MLISVTAATCIAVGNLRNDATVKMETIKKASRSYVRVVAALAHVDMVVGVNGLFGPELAAEDLDGTVRNNLGLGNGQEFIRAALGQREQHLVDIHVALRPTASLEYYEREVINEFAGDDLWGQSAVIGCEGNASRTSSAASWMAAPILGSMP